MIFIVQILGFVAFSFFSVLKHQQKKYLLVHIMLRKEVDWLEIIIQQNSLITFLKFTNRVCHS
uniref:Uncharacterized protein n=1 Tax=Rhizophora mucronata TaxID=61149 RepID=A0A2P2NY46_RHIMU